MWRPSCFPAVIPERRKWAKKLIKELKRGRVEIVVEELRAFPTRKPELRNALRTEADLSLPRTLAGHAKTIRLIRNRRGRVLTDSPRITETGRNRR